MTERIDLEMLVSYVDGQLEERETARVEEALAQDAEARETVRGLRESAELLRSAFNEALMTPLPAGILEPFHRAAVDRPADRWYRSWPAALAASIAMLFVGFGGGALMVDLRVEQKLAAHRALELSDRQARDAALFEALEKSVSGEAVAWRNPDSGRVGEITPVRTFKNRQAQWCREYRAKEVLAETAEIQHAIACREPEGQWKTRAVLITDS